jgi:hypothetical protein
MVGRFDSEQDFIVVKEDGSVYWSRGGTADDQMNFVGIGSADKQAQGRVGLAVPSIGPCYGVSLMYSPDFSRLAIDWGRCYGDRGGHRSTEYARVASK